MIVYRKLSFRQISYPERVQLVTEMQGANVWAPQFAGCEDNDAAYIYDVWVALGKPKDINLEMLYPSWIQKQSRTVEEGVEKVKNSFQEKEGVYRKLAYRKATEKDPLSFPSLKHDIPTDWLYPIPVSEVPDTRWEEFKNDIIRQMQEKKWKSGPSFYEVYRQVGNPVARDDPQAIQELRLFKV